MEMLIQTIISGILAGGIYGLIGVGLALIFGVVELVNFGHADFLMVAMYLSFWFFNLLGLDPYVSFPLVLFIMSVLGFLVFQIIMKRILHAPHQIQMLATLSVGIIFQNLALMLWKANYRNVRTSYTASSIQLGAFTLSVPKVVAFVVAMTVSLILYLFLTKTYTGTSMRAISQNNKAAQLMGVKLMKTYAITFVLGIFMVAIAGVLLIPIYPAYPTIGASFILPAFVVVVIGGLSSIPGAILGGLMVGVVESLSAYWLGVDYQQVAYFILFILVIIFKPQGILSRKKEGI